jgi:hypothetical protein
MRSAVPLEASIRLTLACVTTSVTVEAKDTLIDPHRSTSVNEIGQQTMQTRRTSLPGRALQDLINSQPGWSYETVAVAERFPRVVYKRDRVSARLQADVENLKNRLNVVDFGRAVFRKCDCAAAQLSIAIADKFQTATVVWSLVQLF